MELSELISVVLSTTAGNNHKHMHRTVLIWASWSGFSFDFFVHYLHGFSYLGLVYLCMVSF